MKIFWASLLYRGVDAYREQRKATASARAARRQREAELQQGAFKSHPFIVSLSVCGLGVGIALIAIPEVSFWLGLLLLLPAVGGLVWCLNEEAKKSWKPVAPNPLCSDFYTEVDICEYLNKYSECIPQPEVSRMRQWVKNGYERAFVFNSTLEELAQKTQKQYTKIVIADFIDKYSPVLPEELFVRLNQWYLDGNETAEILTSDLNRLENKLALYKHPSDEK